MEVRSDRLNKAQFLPSSGRVDTAIWMHYVDAHKTVGEKAWRQQDKNAARYIEQVLGATPHKARKLSKLDERDMRDTAGEVGASSWVMYSRGPFHMAEQRQVDQLEPTYSCSV